jgi:DNA-binding transcriptional LysR family regulator
MAVASTLSFTRAAEKVHLAQSSVTEQIRSLEAELDTSLFDRSGRALKLTEAGQRLLEYADRLLDLDREARRAVAGTSVAGGELALGALETLSAQWLSAPLERLRQARPGVSLKLEVAGTGDLLARVRRGDLDACVVFDAETDPGLASTLVDTSQLVIVAPAQHRWKKQRAISPADLGNEPFLVTAKGCTYRRIFDQATLERGEATPNIVGEFESLAAICAMVAQGAGCALMPRMAVPVRDRRIIVRPWHGTKRSAAIHLLRRQQAMPAPALQTFMDLLSDNEASHETMAAVDV